MKKVAYVDPKNPGIVRFYGGDQFDGVLAGTRAQMIVDALNGVQTEVERSPVGWVVAQEGFVGLRVYGPQYLTLKSAEQDAELTRKRGIAVEVWECFVVSPPLPHQEKP